ncbi:uncharacterized protein PSFLO_00689 [Pseudozyma flocculosa]|uniref:Uncharacterized protein n=2 Tax=Pseudozyma flocculosa TaxID=84751 RepID=A0A5C3ESJ2_9BASI|nr:uncharacterized protein PSFLO_00689 [Pseudozyma flocculosa]
MRFSLCFSTLVVLLCVVLVIFPDGCQALNHHDRIRKVRSSGGLHRRDLSTGADNGGQPGSTSSDGTAASTQPGDAGSQMGGKTKKVKNGASSDQSSTSASTSSSTSPSTAGKKICSIADHGANSNADIGPALQAAFSQCVLPNGNGANTVLAIPQGDWILRSHVVLRGGNDFVVQWDGVVTLPHDESLGIGPMIQFLGCQRILVTGSGKFVGGGVNWRAKGLSLNRPNLINFYRCKDSEITGIHLDDAPMFFLGLSVSSGMKVHDMLFTSPPPYMGSTDAIDVQCANCQIYNLDITNGDDSVVMKTPSSNVEVRNITIQQGYGIGIGTAGKNGVFDISNIHASDIRLINAKAGLYVKSYPSASGVIRNVTMENVTLKNVAKPIAIDPFWQGGSMDTPDASNKASTLVIRDFTLKDWDGTGDSTTRPVIFLNGSPAAPMQNMVFEDVHLTKEGGRQPSIVTKNACGSGLPQIQSCGSGSGTGGGSGSGGGGGSGSGGDGGSGSKN